MVDDILADGLEDDGEAGPLAASSVNERQGNMDIQDREENGQEDNCSYKITAPEPRPMTAKLLFLSWRREGISCRCRGSLFFLIGLCQGAPVRSQDVLRLFGVRRWLLCQLLFHAVAFHTVAKGQVGEEAAADRHAKGAAVFKYTTHPLARMIHSVADLWSLPLHVI